MLKTKYKNFLLEKIDNESLKYYCFDWDDNILVMPSLIHVDHLVNGVWTPTDLNTSEFAEIRLEITKYAKGENSNWRFANNNYRDTFSEFRDYGKRGQLAFIDDVMKAIQSKDFGPVWDKFIECMIDGHIFMIITARGHEPETIKSAVKWIIWNYFTLAQRKEMEINLREFNLLFSYDDKNMDFRELVDHYLYLCDFIGITSDYFMQKYNTFGQVTSPERFKTMAIRTFIEKINEFGKRVNRKISVGFSDDDPLTVKHVHKYMKDELSLDFPIDYHVYSTGNGNVTKL